MNEKKTNKRVNITVLLLILTLFPIIRANNPQKKNVTKNEPYEKSAPKPQNKYFKLDNGLKVLLINRDSIPLVNIVFSINVGSKDETPESSGLVHLLEHLILLGETEFNSSEEVNRQMRRHGAHFNAHTSHDLMTFELSVPVQSLDFGLKILHEKLFHLKFLQDKLEKEKKIIFEEMAQHQDDPYKLGMLLALQHLFKGHPYTQPIAGNKEVIKNATILQLQRFYRNYFTMDNFSLVLLGDINIKAAGQAIKKIFGPRTAPARKDRGMKTKFTIAAPLARTLELKEYRDIKQAHIVVAFHAPSSNQKEKLAMNVFNQVMGKGMNPLLSRMMVKRGKRITYGTSTSYIPLIYGGAYLVFITVEPKDLKAAKRALMLFLNRQSWKYKYSVKDYPYSKRLRITDYLETAKSAIKFASQQFGESGMNAAISYARYLLFQYKGEEKERKNVPYLEQLEKVSSDDLRDVASRYFSAKKYVLISILPEKEK